MIQIRKTWPGLVILGILVLSVNVSAQEQGLPEELSFLEEATPPDNLFISGEIVTADTVGRQALMPFRFYWEKGSYAIDVRYMGGRVFLFARGVADTLWIYDFQHSMKIVTLKNQGLGQVTGIPFSPRDLLPIFNVFTKESLDDVVEVTQTDAEIVARLPDDSRYYFNKETELLSKVTKGIRLVTFSDYQTKKGFSFPNLVIFNQGFLMDEAIKTTLKVKLISLKPQDENNLLLSKEPLNMPRAFDTRPE